MPILSSSLKDPRMVDPLGLLEEKHQGDQASLSAYEEELALWNAFSGTRTGQVTAQLADYYIDYLSRLRDMTALEMRQKFPHLSPEEIRETRAELRGELRAWYKVKYRQASLKRLLEEAEKTKEKLRERAERKEGVPEEVKKYV